MQVHILFEAWGSDAPVVIGVFASEIALNAELQRLTENEDDYTASRRHLIAQVHDVKE